jgi:hypothetical protein
MGGVQRKVSNSGQMPIFFYHVPGVLRITGIQLAFLVAKRDFIDDN